MNNHKPILLGVALAIAITVTMDATGYSVFSALPLAPLMFIFWWWQRFPAAEIGFKWGQAIHYVIAAAYPLIVMTVLATMALLSGSFDTSGTNWDTAMLNLFAGGAGTTLAVIITEEGFFRGWLWAALRRSGFTAQRTVVFTSLAFTAWHISAVSLETGFDLPLKQIPIYLVNATLLGLTFGLLREWSGSIIVASVSHGIWNGMAYSLFGFGEKTGALGIQATWIFGPEVGVAGIIVNLIFVSLLWRSIRTKIPESQSV